MGNYVQLEYTYTSRDELTVSLTQNPCKWVARSREMQVRVAIKQWKESSAKPTLSRRALKHTNGKSLQLV